MSIDDLINKTEKRSESFRLMIDSIKDRKNPLIIETGCSRSLNNYGGDGMSTIIFDEYIKSHGGSLYSVDINPAHVELAKSLTTNANIVCSDSVKFLFDINTKLRESNTIVDLLYLDSFDLDSNNPHPSAIHHIMELLAIWPSCGKGTVVSVDDNISDRAAKGMYVKQFMNNIGINMAYDGYQMVWRL
jgi:predicted O-methyltransferase YrrM